jgi:hypothetical protein
MDVLVGRTAEVHCESRPWWYSGSFIDCMWTRITVLTASSAIAALQTPVAAKVSSGSKSEEISLNLRLPVFPQQRTLTEPPSGSETPTAWPALR